MSHEPTRYSIGLREIHPVDPSQEIRCDLVQEPHPEGNWVRAEDYDQLRAALTQSEGLIHEAGRIAGEHKDRADRLLEKLAASEQQRQQLEVECASRKTDFTNMKWALDAADQKAEASEAARLQAEQERDAANKIAVKWRDALAEETAQRLQVEQERDEAERRLVSYRDQADAVVEKLEAALAERTRERDEAREDYQLLAKEIGRG